MAVDAPIASKLSDLAQAGGYALSCATTPRAIAGLGNITLHSTEHVREGVAKEAQATLAASATAVALWPRHHRQWREPDGLALLTLTSLAWFGCGRHGADLGGR